MNKVFKIIWNKSKCCFSVVSEIAKNHKKTKAVSKKTLIVFVSAFLVGSMGIAHAENPAESLTNEQKAVYNAVLKELENKGVHYVSVKGENQDNKSNYKNDGAKGKGAVAIGERHWQLKAVPCLSAEMHTSKATAVMRTVKAV